MAFLLVYSSASDSLTRKKNNVASVPSEINKEESHKNHNDAFTTGASAFSVAMTFVPLIGLLCSIGTFFLSRRRENAIGVTLSIVAFVYNLVFTSILIIGYILTDAVIQQIAPGSSISDLLNSFAT